MSAGSIEGYATAGSCFAENAARWRRIAADHAGNWNFTCRAMSYAARHERIARQMSVEAA